MMGPFRPANYVAPTTGPVQTTTPTTQNTGGDNPDLSNPVKKTDYARSKGFDSWDQYQNSLSAPSPSSNDLEMQQVDSAYGSAMDYLNRAEQAIRGYQPQVEAGISSTYDTNTQLANTQKAQGERQINTAQTDTQSRLQNAISAARQALQESLMGGKQRFGSGSNVYKALGEYGTTKFQQASGQARDTAEQTQRSIQEQAMTLQENYTNAITQLNNWKQTQMASAQQEFMNKLLEIDGNRNEAAQNKSFQKIQLLQDMRSRADAIANQAWTFQQNLEMQRQAYGQQIGSQINTGTSNVIAGANTAATNGANGIASVDMSPVSATSSTSLTPFYDMVGYKKPKFGMETYL
jgi:hypothetical protein